MKVLQVIGKSSGGISVYTRLLCELLRQQGADVTVVQPDSDPDIPDVPTINLPIALSGLKPKPGHATLHELRELAKGADVMHAQGLQAAVVCALALRRLPAAARPRFIVTLHNQIPASEPQHAEGALLLHIACKQADLVFGVSTDLVEAARRHGAKNVQYLFVAAEKAPSSPKTREEIRKELGLGTELCLVTIARLAPQKRLPLLIETAKQMTFSDYRWLIVGEGPLLGELQQQAHSTPIRFLGARDDVGDLLKAADIVVCASLWEGQSIALQEALRAGVPIVTTGAGAIPDVVGSAAVIAPPDAGKIAEALDTLGADAALRTAMRRAALERAAQLPTPEQMLAQMLEAYTIER